jgi:hypothetical protein
MTHLQTHSLNGKQPARLCAAASITSRDANPFATCWTRPGALPFLFPPGESASRLVARLATMQWRGAIVGLHGSGKSTLLEALKPALRAAGLSIHAITLRDGQRRLPKQFLKTLPQKRAVAIVDGFEQLGWFERLRLNLTCRRRQIGLLVSTHAPTRIPTLICLAPDEPLLQKLVAALTVNAPTPLTPADVAASHAGHGMNVREMLFDLYDRHERLRRAERTLIAGHA